MQFGDFRKLVNRIPFGKVLPDATYVYRCSEFESLALWTQEIERAMLAANPREDWNIVKLHHREHAITFLVYPDFYADPHPSLMHSTKINLRTGRVVRTDYSNRANPPVLHRKETFLPESDPRWKTFSSLTSAEEAAGLYRDTSRIGLRLYWNNLVKNKGYTFENHKLLIRQ